MRTLFGATMAALFIACIAAPPAALAQQKTAKACREEWRASTDPGKGTEKDYVAKCRAAGAAAAPSAPAAPSAAAAAPAGAAKTAKACREEWRASTDPGKGTEKDYVARCRGGAAAAAPAAPAAPPPAAAAPAPSGSAKTAKACRDEWRASTDPAKGTQKDYVAKCRGGESAAAPAAPAVPSAAAEPAPGATKTARACRDEWRASTDPNKGTEKDYVAKCRAGVAAAPPAAPPAAAPTAAAPAPAPAPATAAPPAAAAPAHAPAPAPAAAAPSAAPARPAPTAAAPAATAPTGTNQYSTEVQAKGRCPADTVVWVNLNSKIYHFAGTKAYGKTKEGAYMCEKDALGETFRASKNEKHP
jgi:hypothetical protein